MPSRILFAVVMIAAIASMESAARANDSAHTDKPVLLDRIVAVVEDKTIFRSDVIKRGHVWASHAADKDPGALNKGYRDMLDSMIDEMLIAAEVEKAQITSSPQEVELAMVEIGKSNNISRAELVKAVKQQGMTMDEYKAEIRQQLLDAKWTNLRVRPQVVAPTTGTEEEKSRAFITLLEMERKKVLTQLRTQSYVDVRW